MANSKYIAQLQYKFLYINPKWVDIPLFFKEIKSMQKGQVFGVLNDINRFIDGEWEYTYVRNTSKHYSHLNEFYKSMHIKTSMPLICKAMRNDKFKKNAGCSRHAVAQGLEDVFTFPSRVSAIVDNVLQAQPQVEQLLNDAHTAARHLTGTAAHIDAITPDIRNASHSLTTAADSMTEMITSINEITNLLRMQLTTATEKASTFIVDVITYIFKLIALGYLITQPHNQNVANVTALLTLILPSSTLSCIQHFGAGLIRVIQGIIGRAHAQEEVGEDEHTSGFVSSFFQVTVGIIKGLFKDVPKDVFDKMNISNRKIRLIVDYIKNASTIFDFLIKLWEKCMEFIGDFLLKYFNILPSFIREDAIVPLVDEYMEIKQNRDDAKATTSKESARRVVTLYEKILKMEMRLIKQTSRTDKHVKVLPYLRIMLKSLDSVISRIPEHLRTGLAPRRIKPFWVYIYGDPRIGKTAVFQPYIVNALSQALKLQTKYEDYTNYTYLRNCGEDYWEGYNNHPVLWYNDLFQNYADEQAMHKAIMELTNIVDDNVYPLEMAFEQKHCVYFNSELVVSNAQNEMIDMPFITGKCWSGGAHLYARRNICVHMSLNPKYASTVGIDYPIMYKEMDDFPDHCVGYEHCVEHTVKEYKEKLLFPDDLYLLTFTNPENRQVMVRHNFTNGIKYMVQQAQNYKETQTDFKDRLYAHFARNWPTAQEDDDFEDAPQMTEHEFTVYMAAQRAKVEQTMQEVMKDLLMTEDFDWVRETRRNLDTGAYEAISVLYAGNNEGAQDGYIRATYAVEAMGIEYWASRKWSWWQRFRTRCITLVNNIRKKFTEFMQDLCTRFGPLIELIKITVMMYTYYRVMRAYFGFVMKLVTYMNPVVRVPQDQPVNSGTRAETAEGKSKPKQPQILRVKKEKPTAVAMSYDQQNNTVENIVNKQMCKFSLHVVDKTGEEIHSRVFGSGLCVGSDIFLLPYHFWFRWMEMKQHWESHDLKVVLRLHWNEKLSVDIEWDTITTTKLQYAHCEDLIFIRINKLVQKPHLKQFFIRHDDRPMLFEMYMYGMRAQSFVMSALQVTNGDYKTMDYMHESRDDPIFGHKFQTREVVIPIAIKYYNCMSTTGDCGMLLMNCDSKMNSRKIMAMHTAGHSTEGYGIGSLIFYEDIIEAFEILYPESTPIVAQAQSYDVPAEYAIPLQDMGLNVLGKLPRLTSVRYKVDRDPVIMLPRKTKISKSLVHSIMEQDYGPTTMAPARLRPFDDENGERQFPILKAMRKLVTISNSPSDTECKLISEHMSATFCKWRSPYTPFVLTNDQMINGIGNLNPVDMSTSAGYPYVMLNNTNGKLPFFIDNNDFPRTFRMGDEVSERVELRETLAANGIIMETYFIDTLKDETREIHKVVAGKTRLFQIAPMDLNLLIRKYFGAFIMHGQAAYIDGEGAVGINANSLEWTSMIKYQLTVGNSFLNGDGENFDASASQRIGMWNCEAINKWYQQGEDWESQHDVIRSVLFATFLNSKHIYRDVVYMALQGNKSGTAITTWFNNLIGMFAIRLAVLTLDGDFRNYDRGVRPKFYGDDDSTCVNTLVYPGLTCLFYQSIMKRIGIKYTSASKGEVIAGWYKLEDITFLKRTFTFDGIKYLPRLDKRVILEISRWSESDPYNMNDQLNRFNSSLLEMSNYGVQEFTNLRSNYFDYCYKLNRMGVSIDATQLFIFAQCEKIKWGEDYSPLKLELDLARASDAAKVVLLQGCVNDVQLSTSPTNSCQLGVVTSTANSQTYEGKNTPARPQVIRVVKPKAQGEEMTDEDEFNCYMTIMECLKQMQPCIDTMTRVMRKAFRKPEAKWAFMLAHAKAQNMIRIYNECAQLMSNSTMAQAQGEENIVAPTPVAEQGTTPPSVEIAKEDSTQNKSVTQERTTTFVDENTAHQPPVILKPFPRFKNSNVNFSHDDYFAQPVLVDQFEWKDTNKIWDSVGKWHFPESYLVSPITEKLAMIKMGRPEFEIEIVVNATKFHYGRLVFAIQPLVYGSGTKSIDDAYLQPYNVFTWPHWYQLSAGTQQSVKFTVPYRHFLNQIDWTSNEAIFRRLFTLQGYVSAPLQSAMTKTSSVEVSIFARLVKTEFAGHVYSGAVAQGEQEDLSVKGIVTKPVLGPSRVGAISSTLDGFSTVIKDAAHLAYAAGLSTPVNLATTSSMQIRQPLFNKAEDVPNSVVLGPSTAMRVNTDLSCVNSIKDDMNIVQYASHPSLLNTIKLTSTDLPGKTLFLNNLSPAFAFVQGEGITDDKLTFYPTPLGILGYMFNNFRGALKFHFSAISSSFHSARVRIFLNPGSLVGPPAFDKDAKTALRQGSLLRNVIWDINKNADITVVVPFENVSDWIHLRANTPSDFMGSIGLQLINKLTSTSDTVNPIYIQVFVSACDDAQFAFYDKRYSIAITKWGPDFTQATAQGEEDPCIIPASSSMCLRAQAGILLGDIDNRQRVFNESQSYVITSFKQLANMLVPFDKFASTVADKDNITGRSYNPYGNNYTQRKWDDDFWLSPFHLTILLFRFMRGGYRAHLLANDKLQVQAYAWLANVDTYSAIDTASTSDPLNGTMGLNYLTYGYASFYDNSVYPVDVTVPYFNKYMCCATYFDSLYGALTHDFGTPVPTCYLLASTQKAVKTMILASSAADDFMMGYPMSVPRIKYKEKADVRTGRAISYEPPTDTPIITIVDMQPQTFIPPPTLRKQKRSLFDSILHPRHTDTEEDTDVSE